MAMCPSTASSDLPFAFGAHATDVAGDVFAPEVVEEGAMGDRSVLHESMVRLADSAVQAVRHAEGAGVSLVNGDRPVLVASTASFVTRMSRLELEVAEGPGLASARTVTTVLANSLDLDDRWPRLRARVAACGVFSALAVPLRSDGLIGVMTVYARDRDAFDGDDARLVDVLAVPTAVAVRNAQLLAHAEQTTAQLQAVVAGRVVDRAIGIMMSRNGGSEERATALLQQMCDRQHKDLAAMAQDIVEEAHEHAVSRYAQARLRPSAQPGRRDA